MIAAMSALVLAVVVAIGVLTMSSDAPCRELAVATESERGTAPPVGGKPPVVERFRRAFGSSSKAAAYCHDFADPFVLRVGSDYYGYATNSGRFNIAVLSGSGFLGRQHLRDALPQLPPWAKAGKTWAPSVSVIAGRYVMHYTTSDTTSGKQCLSTAIATRPDGPFRDTSAAPMRCDAIDSRAVQTKDGSYLLWSAGGIYAARLSADLRSLVSPATLLLRADQRWEGGVVEAPTMVQSGGAFYLFYAGNKWETAKYATAYARCVTPLGPCVKAPGPWLDSEGAVAGPGGADFFVDGNDRLWMAFHAWQASKVGYPRGDRYLLVVAVEFKNGAPTLVA